MLGCEFPRAKSSMKQELLAKSRHSAFLDHSQCVFTLNLDHNYKNKNKAKQETRLSNCSNHECVESEAEVACVVSRSFLHLDQD